MIIIEIAPLENGAHRNQTVPGTIVPPDGWAIVPDTITVPTSFPFVEITVDDGVVQAMTACVVTEPEPIPEPDYEQTADDDRDAMLIDLDYRMTLLELGV